MSKVIGDIFNVFIRLHVVANLAASHLPLRPLFNSFTERTQRHFFIALNRRMSSISPLIMLLEESTIFLI